MPSTFSSGVPTCNLKTAKALVPTIPPSLLGRAAEGEISLLLIRGGWDPKTRNHIRDVIINEKITHRGSYFETYDVSAKNRALNPEHHTPTLWLKGTRRTAVSLVAVEFGYRGALPSGDVPRWGSAVQMTWARSGAQP